jgi:hypothetical protein
MMPLGTIALVAIAVADPRRSGWRRELTVARLAGIQSLLYVALEWGERAAQGQGVAELWSTPVLAGFVAQLVVALIVVSAVRLTWRLTRPAVLALGSWPRPVLEQPPTPIFPCVRYLRSGPGARAPPRPVVP